MPAACAAASSSLIASQARPSRDRASLSLPETQQPSIAETSNEAQGQQDVDEGERPDVDEVGAPDDGEDDRHQHRGEGQRNGVQGAGPGDERVHMRSTTRSPSRPRGLTTRMIIRIAKATTSFHRLEKYPAARPSMIPKRKPPRTAPGMLPMPPSTAAVNALSPMRKPIRKEICE